MKLQENITNDQELFTFLGRDGLAVLDVYSEWCGPCVAMCSSLQKIKEGIGGSNLNLAICKSDTVNVLKRYRQRSEPVWLFVIHGKAVNIMFGCDVPKLTSLIKNELQLPKSTWRKYYELTDVIPENAVDYNSLMKKHEINCNSARSQRQTISSARRTAPTKPEEIKQRQKDMALETRRRLKTFALSFPLKMR